MNFTLSQYIYTHYKLFVYIKYYICLETAIATVTPFKAIFL